MEIIDVANAMNRLQHKFEIELKDGTKQTRTSTLVEYGSTEPGGYSAMAKTGKIFSQPYLPCVYRNIFC